MYKNKKSFLFLFLLISVISGCGGNSGKTPGLSFALDMVKKHYREVVNKEAIKFENADEGEFLKKEWSVETGDYIDVYAQPSWVYIMGDLPGQELRIKVATYWRRLKSWTYKSIGIYMIKGTEEVRPPDKIPTPPTPPGSKDELTPYVLSYLEDKHPVQGNTSSEPDRLSLSLIDVKVKEAPQWMGPDEDFSYDTMRFNVPVTYSYEVVQLERQTSKPVKHEITVNTIVTFLANKPDAADWLKDNTVKEWKYFEDPDTRNVVEDKVSEVDVVVPELDLAVVEKMIRNYITGEGTYIKSMTFTEKESSSRQMTYVWVYRFNVNYVEPHWNKKDAIEYLGSAHVEIKSYDAGLSWDFENVQMKLTEDKQVQYHTGGALKGLENL